MSNLPRTLAFLREQWASAPPYATNGFVKGKRASGRAYEALAASLGIPCPPELGALGDALGEMGVWIGAWELGDAAAAASDRAHLVSLARDARCLVPRSEMLPLFGRDGDLLLLGRDGAVWSFCHDTFDYDHGTVAPSLDALLARLMDGPEIPLGRLGPRGWLWVDGIEYGWSVGHQHHGERCATSLFVDLAPHPIRPRGPHHFTMELAEAPLTAPRTEPIGVVQLPGRSVVLDADVVTALIRVARERGWTGRAGPLELGESTALLESLTR